MIPLPPIIRSLGGYGPSDLGRDLSAGLAVAAVGLPSAIAYPAIAGLPPETGLYASIAPLVAYALFGPSRQLVVGPDAATMSVLAAVLAVGAASAAPDLPFDRVGTAAALAVGVGALCLLARALRLGALAALLSRPILTGFFAGVSLSIVVGQIGRVTGVSIESDGLLKPFIELASKASAIRGPTLLVAAASFLLLKGLDALRSPIPGPVAVLALSAVFSTAFGFSELGVAVVGAVPASLPAFAAPDFGALPLDRLALGSAAVFLVSFGSGVVAARSFGMRGGYPVDPDRELTGFGAANLAAGAFGAFPVTASDSRTAINVSVGGRTQVTSLAAAGAVAAAILWLGPLLAVLPIPALGAILVSAAIGLIDVGGLRRLWRASRPEFAFAMIALLGPVSLGVLNGVVIAIVATLGHLLVRAMQPRDALLGRAPGREGFYKLHRRPDARPVPGLTLWVLQETLMFFNADRVRDRLLALADGLGPEARWLIVDGGGMPHVDTTGAAALEEAAQALAARGVRLGFAELHAEVRELLDRAGVLDRVGRDMVFEDLDDAYRAFRAASADSAP